MYVWLFENAVLEVLGSELSSLTIDIQSDCQVCYGAMDNVFNIMIVGYAKFIVSDRRNGVDCWLECLR